MDAYTFAPSSLTGMSAIATYPIELLTTRPGLLLRLAGACLRRCRAYPDTPPAAHSGTSNYRV
jgi:hypothetical protein